MKKLLFYLFLNLLSCEPVLAQRFDSSMDSTITTTIPSMNLLNRKFISVFELEDYAKFCYNDSAEYRSSNGFESTIKYTHKEPTFKGFIEWLRQ